jgi:hypothetical protein
MGMGDIIRDSFKLYKKNLICILPHLIEYILDFSLFVAFVIIALATLGLSISAFVEDLDMLMTDLVTSAFFIVAMFIFGFLVMILLLIFFNACARAAIIGMAKEGIEKEKTSLSTGWVSVKKSGLDIFIYLIFLCLIFISLLFVGFLPLILGAIGGAEGSMIFALVFLSIFLTVALFIVVYVILLFVPQQIVLKEAGVIASFKESYRYVRKNIFDVIIYGVVVIGVSIFIGAITLGISLPFHFIHSDMGNIFVQLFQNLLSFVIGLIVAPYFEIVKTYMVVRGRE